MLIRDNIYNSKNKGTKQLAVLVDPDKLSASDLEKLAITAQESGADFFFVGGSLLVKDNTEQCITVLKKNSSLPVILFPGNPLQICDKADAILFLSLISGRNAEMLIGNHVISAPLLRNTGIEILPTGYMLIESGKATSVSYMSNTTPIPSDKNDVAACTAMAGEMLGLQYIFMDAGSGALNPISAKMISKVRAHINLPIIVGGGIKTPEKALENCSAGADIIVVGNAIEKEVNLAREMAIAIKSMNKVNI